MKSVINLAFIGAGWIARQTYAEFKYVDTIKVTGVFTRNLERAQAFAEELEIPFYTDSVDELLAREDVDAVYVATTNDCHKEYVIKALNAKKAVLVEKPIALNEQETLEMVEAAKRNGVLLMEAMWSRFFPAMEIVKDMIQSGVIGQVVSYQDTLGMKMHPLNKRFFKLDQGGGALLDMGVYNINCFAMLTASKVKRVDASMRFSEGGVDLRDDLHVEMEDGVTADFVISAEEDLPNVATITGTKGTISIPGSVMGFGAFTVKIGEDEKYYNFTPERYRYPYRFQFEHFARCVLEGRTDSYLVPMEDTLLTMKIMDACRACVGFTFPQEQNGAVSCG